MAKERGALGNFLAIKFVEWTYRLGDVKKQGDFAAFLGLDPVTFSRYLNGKRSLIDRETVAQLAEKLGEDIYPIVGLINPRVQELTEAINDLDEDEQQELLETLEAIRAKRRTVTKVEI